MPPYYEQLTRYLRALTKFVCLLAILLLAGCVPLSTKPVVKIGLVAPFEGLDRDLGYDVLHAVKLAVRECNASGGAASYMVELVALDDSSAPAQARLSARKMAIDPDVIGVIGSFSSQTALAALEEYHRAGLPFIILASADEVTEHCYPEVFRLSAKNSLLGAEAARYAVRELGATHLAVLHDESDLVEAFVEEARRLGTDVVEAEASRDWLSRVKGADLIFFGGGAVEGAELVRQIRVGAHGRAPLPDIPFMGGSELGDAKLVKVGREAAKGILYINSAPAVDLAAYEALAGHPPGPWAILAYDATEVLLEALEKAIERDGKPAREGVIASLARVHHIGLSGDIAFDACGDRVDPPIHIYRIEGDYPGRCLR